MDPPRAERATVGKPPPRLSTANPFGEVLVKVRAQSVEGRDADHTQSFGSLVIQGF